MELMKLARFTVEEFSEIPASAKEEVVHDLVDGLESIFLDYISFVASCGALGLCSHYEYSFVFEASAHHQTQQQLTIHAWRAAGSKHSYLPPLPPLTRCNQDSGFFRLWKKAALPTCQAPEGSPRGGGSHHAPRPTISRGTQRLYVRLNTLHYVLTHVQALDASLSSPPSSSSARFGRARDAAAASISAVAEVFALRLIILDSRNSLYQGLYARGVGGARIRPALRLLRQNLSFLLPVLADRAQPAAVREVMRASLEAFLMVLLAGGNERSFARADHAAVEEDLRSLKRAFCTCGEGLVPEDVVAREAGTAEAVVDLMARSTECLIEAFCIAAAESASAGKAGATSLLPTKRRSGGRCGNGGSRRPATTGRRRGPAVTP